jgi:hypothetical protein
MYPPTQLLCANKKVDVLYISVCLFVCLGNYNGDLGTSLA